MTKHNTQEQNAILNEEYKIWKKATPFLYNHITTYKLLYSKTDSNKQDTALSTFVFDTADAPHLLADSQAMTTSKVYYTRGQTIYSMDLSLPRGLMTAKIEEDALQRYELPTEETLKVKNEYKIINSDAEHDYVKIKKMPRDILVALDTNSTIKWVDCSSGEVSMSFKCNTAKNLQAPQTTNFEIYNQEKIVTSSGEVIDYKTGQLLYTLTGGQDWQNPKFSNADQIVYINKQGTALELLDIGEASGAEPVTCVSYTNDEYSDERPSKITAFDQCPVASTFFVTGSNDGVIKLWDSRIPDTPIHSFNHYYNEIAVTSPISKIQFKPDSPTEFFSVCAESGYIYQWDIRPLVNYQSSNGKQKSSSSSEDGTEPTADETNAEDEDQEMLSYEQLNEMCLKYIHTSGSRRKTLEEHPSFATKIKLDQCAWNPYMNDVIGTLDLDGTLVVYKGWFGRNRL